MDIDIYMFAKLLGHLSWPHLEYLVAHAQSLPAKFHPASCPMSPTSVAPTSAVLPWRLALAAVVGGQVVAA